MFCKNCGEQLQQDDLFCSNCGQKTDETSTTINQAASAIKNFDYKNVFNYFKSYIITPGDFYTSIEQSEKLKVSGIFLFVIAILSPIMNILIKYSVTGKICSYVKEASASMFGSSSNGLMSYLQNRSNLINITSSIREGINSAIPNGKIIAFTILGIILFLILLGGALEIINITLLKKQLAHEDIALITVTSYMPMLTIGLLAALLLNISPILAILILLYGPISIYIRIHTGVLSIGSINKNKSHISMIIIIALLILLLTLIIVVLCGDLPTDIIKKLVHDLR